MQRIDLYIKIYYKILSRSNYTVNIAQANFLQNRKYRIANRKKKFLCPPPVA